MTIREEKDDCRMRILLEVISENGIKPIALGELAKRVNDKVKDMYKLSPLELSSLLKQVKEYKKYTNTRENTSYIFIKWKRLKE